MLLGFELNQPLPCLPRHSGGSLLCSSGSISHIFEVLRLRYLPKTATQNINDTSGALERRQKGLLFSVGIKKAFLEGALMVGLIGKKTWMEGSSCEAILGLAHL